MTARSLATLATLALTASGCRTVAPATWKVNPETLPNCTRACAQVGMKLTGIIFVENYGGCVCESAAPGAQPTGVEGRGAALGGSMVTIVAAREREERSQQQQPHTPMRTPGAP
jgi:hypothetical protein